jgi:hypothetical protein
MTVPTPPPFPSSPARDAGVDAEMHLVSTWTGPPDDTPTGVSATATDACAECTGAAWMRSSQVNYDHIHRADLLPTAKHTESRRIVRGYAVGIDGAGISQTWVFFENREPAVVFGRAGRMSYDISGYGVYEAAWEVRFDPRQGKDVRTLHIGPHVFPPWDQGPNVGETADFLRWVEGCNPGSSQYEPKPVARRP